MRVGIEATPKQVAQIRAYMQAVEAAVGILAAGADLEQAQFVGIAAGKIIVEVPDVAPIENGQSQDAV